MSRQPAATLYRGSLIAIVLCLLLAFITMVNATVAPPACTPISFANTSLVPVGSSPRFSTMADYNGDGIQDIAVANFPDNTVSIRLGDGSGGFGGTGTIAVGIHPARIEVGDLNGDGYQDFVTANFDAPASSGASASVCLGNGAGGFSRTDINVGTSAIALKLGDFNGDGKLDIVAVNLQSNTVSIRLGDGAGGFGGITTFPVGSTPTFVAVGDFNGDGKQDLAVSNAGSSNVSIKLGNGAGGFAPPMNFAAGCTPVNLAIADFNHDGKADLVVGNETSNRVSVLLGNGMGGFSAPTSYITGDHATTVAAADFNGDNNLDIVVQVRFGNSSVAVLLGDGAGNFSAPTYFPVGVGPFALAAADLNHDGKPDIAVADPNTTNVYILLNTCNPPDTTAPAIICPANITAANTAGQCSANINPGAATATDNRDGAITPVGVRSDGQTLTAPYPLGTTTITWTATDHAGNSASCQQTVTVNDTQPPAIICPANISVAGNLSGQCAASVNMGTATATDNCSGVTMAGVRSDNQPLNAPYPLGITTITWKATDAAGNLATCPQTITVTNPNPAATITSPPSGSIYAVGTSVSFQGGFTDNPGGPHTAIWAFDNLTQTGTVDETTGAVNAIYTFTAAGVYLVTLTINDGCGGIDTSNTVGGLTAMVVIYNPDGGFVTGGGWINSPAGAYPANPSLTGNASFGFVSKYQRGATVPTGNTEFQFRAASFNFKSSSYDWLVVAGARAQYKGTGTVNGNGSYGFLLTAIDGEVNGGGVDKFRIKIWDKNNNDVVIYDNQIGADDNAAPTTALGGGSIIIHR